MQIRHPASVRSASVHEISWLRRASLLGILVAAYALSGSMCWDSMGDPYRAAVLEQATKKDTRSLEVDASTSTTDLMEILSELVVEAEAEPLPEANATNGTNATSTNSTSERPRPLPSPWLPGAWACAVTFVTLTSHAFFHLLCHWFVWFKVWATFQPVSKMREGAYVFMDTHMNRGKPELCLISKTVITRKLGFEFQRQKYECLSGKEDKPSDAGPDELVGQYGNGAVRVIAPPSQLPLCDYIEASGHETARCTERAEALYGRNKLTVATPRFLDLYREQLVSPLVVFQLFTALLWMLDEYWQFVCFQIFMVLLLESTTVFQRIKTFGTLNSMSSKPFFVQAYRQNKWHEVSTDQLYPGDLISLVYTTKKAAAPDAPAADKSANPDQSSVNTIPCDCLLLTGDAVVNEATLTGESVPQMKTCIEAEGEKRPLELEKADRMHVLFSGTSLVTTRNKDSKQCSIQTPDEGCLCYVLRTGFSSSQGTFMQMIECSTHKLSDGSKETGYALLFLLMFALAAAGYVFQKGMEKGDRTTHELLIKCVIIITATVPKQLPMQMAMAVNTALMGLMKNGVFCTEPFRVPVAGKISHCLFDKTGTITTDQLVPVGIVNNTSSERPSLQEGDSVRIEGLKSRDELNGQKAVVVTSAGGDGRLQVMAGTETLSIKSANCVPLEHQLTEVVQAETEVALVLSGCHSLVEVDDVGLVGDPIEMAALRGIGWRYLGGEEKARPGNWETTEKTLAELKATLDKMKPEDKKRDGVKEKISSAEQRIETSKDRAKKSLVSEVQIVHRHHFESGLQRMSVVAKATGKQSFNGFFCLVKGSPEAIGNLLAEGNKPEWYDATYQKLARRGMRVLALAMRPCPEIKSNSDNQIRSRSWVESDLLFAGFIAFECRSRVDSGMVIGALIESAHKVAMVTGDAALTALHIAREVGICDPDKQTLVLQEVESGQMGWMDAFEPEKEVAAVGANLAELREQYNLMLTESALQAAGAEHPQLWDQVEAIQVFARMSPSGKAAVIAAIQKQGHHVLMCGDGGNDVGALKQSDVGMALLSGYGNVNAADEGQQEQEEDGEEAELKLNKRVDDLKKAGAAAQKLMKEEMNQVKKDLTNSQKQWMMDEIEARRARGEDVGIMATMGIMKETMTRMKNELMAAQKDIQRKHGNIFDKDKSIEKMEEDMSTTMPVVRPGDASVAAPFTSRAPSIKNVVDLIRQGRCTLLSALQNQQIMMLECIISSYCISALSLEGGRSSERQMMASSWLIMIASIAFSYATPIERMSKIQPLSSLFHPAVFVSMLGQAALHLGCLVFAVRLATEEMGPEALREVVDFHKKQKMIRLGQLENPNPTEDMDWTEWAMATWNIPFLPNLLNTVIFLVETSQMIAVMFVNYKGRPWMKGLLENKPLFLSSFACIGLVVTCAWGFFPQVNELIHLAPFPNDAFRYKVVVLVTLSIFGTFVWDRLIAALFAPEIFQAQLDEIRATKLSDILSVFSTLGKILIGLAIYGTGNPLIWFGAWWFWRNRGKKEE